MQLCLVCEPRSPCNSDSESSRRPSAEPPSVVSVGGRLRGCVWTHTGLDNEGAKTDNRCLHWNVRNSRVNFDAGVREARRLKLKKQVRICYVFGKRQIHNFSVTGAKVCLKKRGSQR